MISICAVIATRNDAQYLRVLIPMLSEQGIDVAIIDNGSTDETLDVCSDYAGYPIILVEHLPFDGTLNLPKILDKKREIIKKINHDWVMHHDSDEVFEHFKPGLSLRNAIEDADNGGYNVLNFEEFVFLPEPEKSYTDQNYYKKLLRYYFFEPRKNRLNRAWKRGLSFDNTVTGGHLLSGANISIFPANHVMRHYIVLSYEHARRKYLNRTHSEQGLKLGWHGNRLNFTEENLRLPGESPFLYRLESYESKDFFKGNPVSKHYWEWDK